MAYPYSAGQRRASAPVAYAIVNDVPADTARHFRAHEGIEFLSYSSQGWSDFSGFDRTLAAIHARTNPLVSFARQLADKRILWVDPHPENNDLAFEKMIEAAQLAGEAQSALVTAESAAEGIEALDQAAASRPFDLTITHWGEGAARDDAGGRTSTAEALLSGIRKRGLRCPVVIFASRADAERRRSVALGLGADWVNSARGFMFSLGCIQAQRCHTNECPVGVTTHARWLQRGLVVPEKAERVRRFHRQTVGALAELAGAAGLDSAHGFAPHHFLQRFGPGDVRPLDQVYGFVEPGCLMDGDVPAPLREAWSRADPGCFS